MGRRRAGVGISQIINQGRTEEGGQGTLGEDMDSKRGGDREGIMGGGLWEEGSR